MEGRRKELNFEGEGGGSSSVVIVISSLPVGIGGGTIAAPMISGSYGPLRKDAPSA